MEASGKVSKERDAARARVMELELDKSTLLVRDYLTLCVYYLNMSFKMFILG